MIEQHIDHPAAWTAATIGSKEELVFELRSPHLAAFAKAIEDARRQGLSLYEVERERFPLDAIEADLKDIKPPAR